MDNVVLYVIILNTINTLKEKRRNRSRVIKGEDISSSDHPRYHELWEDDTYFHNTIGDMIFDCSWALEACLKHHIEDFYYCFDCRNNLQPEGWYNSQKELFDFLNTYDSEKKKKILKKNRPVTQFLYKYLNKEKNCGIYNLSSQRNKPILDKDTTVIAFGGQDGCNTERKSWVFCRIDTPYNEKLVSIEDSYKFRHNGKDMISFFVIIDTQLHKDTEHRNKCVWWIETVNVCFERAFPLLPKAFTDNYY